MFERARVEAFSDGVFAVAITLLALDLTVGGAGGGTLLARLGHQWPVFAAYVVSFFTVGVVWVNHHSLFRQLRGVDRPVLFLNLLLLLFVVAIPFAASTLAEYLRDPGQDGHVAAALFVVVMEGMAVSFVAIFGHAVRHDLLARPLHGRAARAAVARWSVGIVVYLVAFGVAFVSAPATLAVVAAITGYYVVERVPDGPGQLDGPTG